MTNKLKFYRILAELTQFEIAKRCKMSQAKYSSIERGDREPNIFDRAAISEVLGVSSDNLWPELKEIEKSESK